VTGKEGGDITGVVAEGGMVESTEAKQDDIKNIGLFQYI
jgi:hypothetical protein